MITIPRRRYSSGVTPGVATASAMPGNLELWFARRLVLIEAFTTTLSRPVTTLFGEACATGHTGRRIDCPIILIIRVADRHAPA